MKRIEIITYARSTGDVFHSHKVYPTASAAEKALKTIGFKQNPNLPDIWYNECHFAKIKEIVP